jgi:hypothetical protein
MIWGGKSSLPRSKLMAPWSSWRMKCRSSKISMQWWWTLWWHFEFMAFPFYMSPYMISELHLNDAIVESDLATVWLLLLKKADIWNT